jgi:hypothetical protein
MGKPATLLEKLCDHIRSFGGESIEVEYQDGSEWVYARKGNLGFSIANFKSSSEDGKELRRNLYAAAKKPLRAVVGGELSILSVRIFDSFGEDAFEVSIEPAPKRNPLAAPSFTAKQGQYLAFIYHYSKVHRRAPAEADLQEYFRVSPPSVHEMIKTLERNGLIERIRGQARSIRLLVRAEDLPELK